MDPNIGDKIQIAQLCRYGCDLKLPLSIGRTSAKKWIRKARIHQVEILALKRLSQCPASFDDKAIQEIKGKLRKAQHRQISRNARFLGCLSQLVDIARESRTPLLLLKGLSLDQDGTRESRDLDILVPKQRVVEFVEKLESLGFEDISPLVNYEFDAKDKSNREHQLSWNNQLQLHNPDKTVLVEVHWNLFQASRTYDIGLDSILKQVDRLFDQSVHNGKLACSELSPEHKLLVACLYAAIRYTPARRNTRLKAYIDIANLIEGQFDHAAFIREVETFEAQYFVIFAIEMCQRIFQEPMGEEFLNLLEPQLNRREKWMLKLALAPKTDGLKDSGVRALIARISTPFLMKGSVWQKIKWLTLMPILAPPKWKIAKEFGIEEDSPWIPACYVANPFRRLFLILYHTSRSVLGIKKAAKT